MIALRRLLARLRLPALFWREDGAVLAEALIAVPFVTLFAVGILEFGNIFWQRMQIENGLRDAARYWARCYQGTGTFVRVCSEDVAKNLAYYGSASAPSGTPLRVPGWSSDVAGEDITITGPDANGTITFSTSHLYNSSPLFGWLGIAQIHINSYQQEQYSGW